MKLDLIFNDLSLGKKDEDKEQERKEAVAAAKAKKKAAEETVEEAFDRIGEMKFTDKEIELYRLAREGFFAGKIGRLAEGKMNKGEVLSMGMRLQKQQEDVLREQRIKHILDNKPENFHIITKDTDLPRVIERIREECRRQTTEWKDRFEVLGVQSMTAGDYEGTGIDSYMDISIGFGIWLPILDEGYYLAYGHVDMRGKEGFEHIPDEYAFHEGDAQLTRSIVMSALAPYLANEQHGKTFHMGSSRYDLHVGENDGTPIKALRWDTLDAMYIMTEHLESYALKKLIRLYGKYFGLGDKEVYAFDELFGNGSPAPFSTELVGIYGIWDVLYGWKLFEWQFETMKQTNNLIDCYANIDSHLPETDAFMARAGFNISLKELAALEVEFDAKLQKAKDDLFSTYKIDDNFLYEMSITVNGKKIRDWKEKQAKKKKKLQESIDKQVAVLLDLEEQGKTHLKRYANTKEQIAKYREQLKDISTDAEDSPFMIQEFELTNNGHIGYLIYDYLQIEDKTPRVQRGKTRSTASGVLEMYYEDEESLKPLATIAEYEKLLSTYIRKIPQALEGDGRFRCEWKSTGTATGRYSSSGYNGRRIDLLDEFKDAE